MSKRVKNNESESEDPSAEPVGFNHLPYDCFHLIFRRLTLRQVLALRRVCPIWNGHILNLCHEKHSLKLILYNQPSTKKREMDTEELREMDLYYTDDLIQCLEDNRSSDQNRHDFIKIDTTLLTFQNITRVTQLFPSLTNLIIVFNCKNQISNVNRLERLIGVLACPNLVHFSIWITKFKLKDVLPKGDSKLMERLHQMVSEQASQSLATVRQLDLCYGIGGLYFPQNRQIPELNLPRNFLSKLEKISLDCYSDQMLNKILRKLSPSLTDLSIDLRLNIDGLEGWAEKLEKSPIAKSVTHLRLFLEKEEQLRVFAQVFQEVKNLQIGCDGLIALTPNWFTTLSTLPHLSTLRLHRFDLVHPPETTSKLLQPTLQSLPSVKHLTMYQNFSKPSYFNEGFARTFWNQYCNTLSGHFPHLELLSIITGRHANEADGLKELLEGKYYFKELAKHFTEFRNFDLT